MTQNVILNELKLMQTFPGRAFSFWRSQFLYSLTVNYAGTELALREDSRASAWKSLGSLGSYFLGVLTNKHEVVPN